MKHAEEAKRPLGRDDMMQAPTSDAGNQVAADHTATMRPAVPEGKARLMVGEAVTVKVASA